MNATWNLFWLIFRRHRNAMMIIINTQTAICKLNDYCESSRELRHNLKRNWLLAMLIFCVEASKLFVCTQKMLIPVHLSGKYWLFMRWVLAVSDESFFGWTFAQWFGSHVYVSGRKWFSVTNVILLKTKNLLLFIVLIHVSCRYTSECFADSLDNVCCCVIY